VALRLIRISRRKKCDGETDGHRRRKRAPQGRIMKEDQRDWPAFLLTA